MSRTETALQFFRQHKDLMEKRVNEGIEQNRKGDAEILFTTKNGELPKDITVEVRQKTHAFKFGCNIFMLDELETAEKNALYREKFPECFNVATVPFYWDGIEPQQDQLRYAADSPKVYRRPAPDLCIDYCKEKGIMPKCHCLNYDMFTPDWAVDLPTDEFKVLMEKRFREIAERYADDITDFEVTNESLRRKWKTKFYCDEDFVQWSFRTAEKYFPNNNLLINDYNIWNPRTFNNRTHYFMQIENLLREGVRIDTIGLQYHGFFQPEEEEKKAKLHYNPDCMFRLLDLYARFGLKEQITEMTVAAYGNDEENEYVQAELLKNTYSVFFSHAAIDGIFYWNLIDGYAAYASLGDMTAGENFYHGGLLRFDMSEKPAYKTLKHLINTQWKTNCTVKAQKNTANFRGFYGDYELIIHANGKSIPVNFKLSEAKENKITVEI